MMEDLLPHEQDELIPPVRLMHDGPRGRDMFKQGLRNCVKQYESLLELPRNANVDILDIGCGIGRKTIPLMEHLGPDSVYIGIDPVRSGIEWLNRNVASRDPRFRFIHADIYSKFYNPRGSIRPEDYRLPVPSRSVDIVVAWSVFTHLTPDATLRYFDEIARVLKPGARMAASFFLLDEDSLEGVAKGVSRRPMFLHGRSTTFYVTNPSIPEDASGFAKDWLLARLRERGLEPSKIVHGHWSRIADPSHPRHESWYSQDFILSTR